MKLQNFFFNIFMDIIGYLDYSFKSSKIKKKRIENIKSWLRVKNFLKRYLLD